MCTNIGKYDRLLRTVSGLILLIVAIAQLVSGVWLWVTYFFAVVLLLTGIFGWCCAYSLLKINTCSTSSGKESCNSMDAVTKNDIENAVKTDSEIKEVLRNEAASALAAEKVVVKKVTKKSSVKKAAKKTVAKKSTKKTVAKKSTKKAAKKK